MTKAECGYGPLARSVKSLSLVITHRALSLSRSHLTGARLRRLAMTEMFTCGMLSGDEAYGLSRALRARDVMTGAPVGPYDYFVASDEYGRNSYITLLTGIQILFGPTPYSMRLLNTLLFLVAGILLFRLSRSAFGSLPAFLGLTVFLFLPNETLTLRQVLNDHSLVLRRESFSLINAVISSAVQCPPNRTMAL